MEPVTLTASAIAVLIATKAFEKTGEKLTESVWNSVEKFSAHLQRKDPKTAEAIAVVAKQPELAQQQPTVYGEQALIEKVENLVQNYRELRKLTEAIQTAVQAQPNAVVNLTKLAEKIGVVNQGPITNQTNTINL
jgi:DNA repair exonuclease SbcCD ATPase subunit